MDQVKILNFKKQLADHNNVLIVLPEYINTDSISAAAALFNFLNTQLKKNVCIASSSAIPERFRHILNIGGVEERNIIHEILPLRYVIKVLNAEKNLEIAVDRREESVDILMIPKQKEIDLSGVKIETVGHKFDYFIILNTRDLEDTGAIYSANKDLFLKGNMIGIASNLHNHENLEIISSDENSTVSETVLGILEAFGNTFNQATKDLLFEGIVSGTDGLHRVKSLNPFDAISKLSVKADIDKKMKNIFYGFSEKGLDLRKRIFANLKQNENFVYSELSDKDLYDMGIQGHQMDGIDFLPFGIVEEKYNYILAYPHNSKRRILIETNNINNFFDILKRNNYQPIKSNNIIAVTTTDTVDNIMNIISGNGFVAEQATEEESSSQAYSTEPESELFVPNTNPQAIQETPFTQVK